LLICCRFSGIDRKPPYTHPTLSDLPGATEYFESRAKDHPNTAEIYVGACHCQAIKFAVLSKPMKEARVIDCACSICLGVSDIGLSLDRDVDGSSLLTAPTLLALHIRSASSPASFLLRHSSPVTRPTRLHRTASSGSTPSDKTPSLPPPPPPHRTSLSPPYSPNTPLVLRRTSTGSARPVGVRFTNTVPDPNKTRIRRNSTRSKVHGRRIMVITGIMDSISLFSMGWGIIWRMHMD